jgi:HD-GYP domain-containing protein (c-di-GMP phosphodiesterase class II)
MALADVYDALISQRPYKPAMTGDEAATVIIAESGKRFDPAIVEVFSSIREKFKIIHLNFEKSGVE